jgi:hypothetical protein
LIDESLGALMADDKDPKFWVTVLKLVAGAVVLLTLFGLGLYYTAKFDSYKPAEAPPDTSWGITKDSPIRGNR